MCGEDPLPSCPAWGQPVTLDVLRPRSAYVGFPPYPGARVAIFAGEEVDVTLHGFEPGRQVQIYTTYESLHLLRYWPDAGGNVEFPLILRAERQVVEHQFVVVQPGDGGRDPLAASFTVVMLPEGAGQSLDVDLAVEALASAGIAGAD